MGLSRKAWNNVVIFAMLIMIFFLNGLHHKLNPNEQVSAPQRLLPEQTFVLTLAFPGYKIERIGTAWRSEGPWHCLLYTSPSPRDRQKSRMPSSA